MFRGKFSLSCATSGELARSARKDKRARDSQRQKEDPGLLLAKGSYAQTLRAK